MVGSSFESFSMATAKKDKRRTRVDEDAEHREPSCTVEGKVSWCSRCGNSMEGPPTVKNRTIPGYGTPTFGYLSRENKISISKMFTAVFVFKSQDMETTPASAAGGLKEENVVSAGSSTLLQWLDFLL